MALTGLRRHQRMGETHRAGHARRLSETQARALELLSQKVPLEPK
eukprot:CAMPEP_0179061726 /NCGR_PEP_ID=MMETSP0796-20121207/26555_1 /TAXON_ID=73915 /ORGANISM="Pyrodinium bahamense, Strain pbaha01" /LENGTH=44 /DNA_ID= /DNA_START= /DNA_END= /DNA_ORIENTATION=